MLLHEKVDNLRGRRFMTDRHAKIEHIRYRLTRQANTNIGEIVPFKTKKNLSKKMKTNLLEKYSFTCQNRNCCICNL